MIVIYGTKMYGRAMTVPGLGDVKTQFFHVYYIPIIPLRSYLLFEENDDSFNGAKIGFNLKSILMAWVFAACIIGAIVSGIGVGMYVSNGFIFSSVLSGSFFVFFVVGAWAITRLRSVATYEQAVKLATKIGVDERGMVVLAAQYGRISEDDLARKVAQFEAEDQRDAEVGAEYAARTTQGRDADGAIPAPVNAQAGVCRKCQREVPPNRDRCLYCGGPRA